MKNPTETGGKVEKKPDKPKQDNPEQSKRFVETAEDIGAVDDEKALDQVLGRIAKVSTEKKEKSDQPESA